MLWGRGGVDPESFEALRGAGRFESWPQDAVLWHEDSGSFAPGVVLGGILRHQNNAADGHRRIVNLVLPGDILNPKSLARRGYTVEAATPVACLRVRPSEFARLCQALPRLAAASYRSCLSQLDRLRWLTWTILALGTEARVAAFLDCAAGTMPVEKSEDGRTIMSLILPRRDIADLLSTSAESVCRALKHLEREGLIRMRTPTQVEILDAPGLRVLGATGSDCPLVAPGRAPAPPGAAAIGEAAARGGPGVVAHVAANA
jgi:CRP/FNR family transcriptional regulator